MAVFVDVLLLVGFGEFLTLSWYLCIITLGYFIIPQELEHNCREEEYV